MISGIRRIIPGVRPPNLNFKHEYNSRGYITLLPPAFHRKEVQQMDYEEAKEKIVAGLAKEKK